MAEVTPVGSSLFRAAGALRPWRRCVSAHLGGPGPCPGGQSRAMPTAAGAAPAPLRPHQPRACLPAPVASAGGGSAV